MNNIKKILIVDDDINVVNGLGSLFEKNGFLVLKAKDGQGGLNMALSNIPDIIILDINMPVMNGLTMLDKLRNDKRCVEIPVIILSGLSNEILIQYSLESTAQEYLNKNTCDNNCILEKAKKYLE